MIKYNQFLRIEMSLSPSDIRYFEPVRGSTTRYLYDLPHFFLPWLSLTKKRQVIQIFVLAHISLIGLSDSLIIFCSKRIVNKSLDDFNIIYQL